MYGRLGRSARRTPCPRRERVREQKASQQPSSLQQSLLSLLLLLLPVVPLLLLSALLYLPSRYTGIYWLPQSVKGRVGGWGWGHSDRAAELEASPKLSYLVQSLVTY